MPNYKTLNALNNTNKLPDFYWTGNTKMNCLKNAINNSLDNSYAHHIQRLMITGNYALLTQTNPDEVDAWYLGIYADAVEWVQLPNTRGMSQFADGSSPLSTLAWRLAAASSILILGNPASTALVIPPSSSTSSISSQALSAKSLVNASI